MTVVPERTTRERIQQAVKGLPQDATFNDAIELFVLLVTEAASARPSRQSWKRGSGNPFRTERLLLRSPECDVLRQVLRTNDDVAQLDWLLTRVSEKQVF